MRYSCLHTHTDFCDGRENVESMCRAAAERGLVSIGFSSHAPMPHPFDADSTWHMRAERLEEYAVQIRSARSRWSGKLDVYLGLEIDYVAGACGPADRRFDHLGLDFVIGSVHYLVPRNAAPFTVDGPLSEWEEGVRAGYAGDGEAAAAAYWEAVASMVAEGGLDVVGHIDLVKKNNRDGSWFDPNGSAYRAGARGAVEAVARAGTVVEVNTGGLNRGTMTEVYPAPWLLEESRKSGIRMTVNADAHSGEHLGGHYEEARRALLSAGYEDTVLFGGRAPSGRPIWITEPL